jgi:hypothetical protein
MDAAREFLERYVIYLPELTDLPLELMVVLAGFGVIGAWLTDMALKHAGFGMIMNFFVLQMGVAAAFLIAMADFRIVLTDSAPSTIAIAIAGGCTLFAVLAAIKNRLTP